jgi:hypothetical protein
MMALCSSWLPQSCALRDATTDREQLDTVRPSRTTAAWRCRGERGLAEMALSMSIRCVWRCRIKKGFRAIELHLHCPEWANFNMRRHGADPNSGKTRQEGLKRRCAVGKNRMRREGGVRGRGGGLKMLRQNEVQCHLHLHIPKCCTGIHEHRHIHSCLCASTFQLNHYSFPLPPPPPLHHHTMFCFHPPPPSIIPQTTKFLNAHAPSTQARRRPQQSSHFAVI